MSLGTSSRGTGYAGAWELHSSDVIDLPLYRYGIQHTLLDTILVVLPGLRYSTLACGGVQFRLTLYTSFRFERTSNLQFGIGGGRRQL